MAVLTKDQIANTINKYNDYTKAKHKIAEPYRKDLIQKLQLMKKDIDKLIESNFSIPDHEYPNLVPYILNSPAGYIGSAIKYLSWPIIDVDHEMNLWELCSKKIKDFGITHLIYTEPTVRFNMRCISSYQNYETNTAFTHDFGVLSIYASSGYNKPIAESIKSTIIKRGQLHPHINGNGYVCLGSYSTYTKDLVNRRLADITLNLHSLLAEYNPSSLMGDANIFDWIGHKCDICADLIKKDMVRCTKSGINMHKECSVEYDGDFYSPIMMKTCSVCENTSPFWVLKDKSIICKTCGEKNATTNSKD